ncbi:hypothetical protein L3V82_08825 [Thiotrichales bacterium 19S3-7]|nr:hypothetical protein [Thiotrichales bacterium 19S3-7]MCF6802177.1 hypothetical protein [Thiotrichales bacterium 19S3-11]
MSLSFYKKSTILLFGCYLGLQIVICYIYGGWLIVNIHDIDGYVGVVKAFLIATDVSILCAALISLTSLITLQLRLLSRTILLINMLIYMGMMVFDFLNPPSTVSELLLYSVSSLMVIISYILYETLIKKADIRENDQ